MFEFSRTHWAIKDADLFEVLLKAGLGQTLKPKVFDLSNEPADLVEMPLKAGLGQSQKPRPKVFALSNEPVDTELVAVMMPFDARFKPVYSAFALAVTAADMKCQRVDDIWVNDHIIEDIVSLICRASVVICDLTDRNANVFYEMGIAHTLGKDVIMVAQSKNDIPFDVVHIRHILYLPNDEGLRALAANVTRRLTVLQARR